MAGFEVIIYGRFWVITEDARNSGTGPVEKVSASWTLPDQCANVRLAIEDNVLAL
jgi:hypothetical protein